MDFREINESLEDSSKLPQDASKSESLIDVQLIEEVLPTDDEFSLVEDGDKIDSANHDVDKDDENEETNSQYRQNDIMTHIDFELLPEFFKNVCASFEDKDTEMMLLTTLAVVSSTLPNVYGIYNHERMSPNLFLYLIGKAGSGKGNITWAKRLLKAIESVTINELIGDNTQSLIPALTNPEFKGVKIQIPANNTYAGFVRLLQLQKGTGLIFETEGDTLSNAFKSEHGNFSDLLRKAFHHESITQFRKTGDESVDIQEPKLSIVISSTPNQFSKFIGNSENGLFSRFMYCETEQDDRFLDVFSKPRVSRESIIDKEAVVLKELFLRLRNGTEVCFEFTEEQQHAFLEFFQLNKSIVIHLCHGDLEATIHRLGLIFFRIAMILTVFRNGKSKDIQQITCSDSDFEVSKALVSRLLVTANKIFKSLPLQITDKLSEKQKQIFSHLPYEFKTIELKSLAKEFGLAERSADRFLKSKCFIKIGHGLYRKLE